MKRVLFLLIAVFSAAALAFPGFAANNYEPEENITAEAYYLYNIDTETLIGSKNADVPRSPASLTKIMTCILAIENTEDLDREMVTYPNYVQDYLYTYQLENGAVSLGGLMAGEEMSMRNMLYALMLPSANEAAMVIADHIAGGQAEFAEMMNARAKELGATNTHFSNPNGLYDPNHTTTAHDMALITLHAITMPELMEIASTSVYDSGPTNKHDNLHWENTNEMQLAEGPLYYEGLKGVKTGTIPEAGRNFISTATRSGFTYLCVVMGSDYLDEEGVPLPRNMAFADTKILYDWAFSSFKIKTLVEKNKYVSEIPIRLSMDKDYVTLMTADRFTSLIYYTVESSSVTIVPEIPESIDAPVKKGDKIGTASLILSGEEIGRLDLLAVESVEASQVLIILEKVKAVTRSFWFKFAVVFLVLVVIAYIVLMITRNRNRRRFNRTYRPRRRM